MVLFVLVLVIVIQKALLAILCEIICCVIRWSTYNSLFPVIVCTDCMLCCSRLEIIFNFIELLKCLRFPVRLLMTADEKVEMADELDGDEI